MMQCRERQKGANCCREQMQHGMLFDHLVGASEQQRRHVEAERLRRLEVDHQLELGWLLNRQIARLDSLEELPDVLDD
jgi:hypothetical protein